MIEEKKKLVITFLPLTKNKEEVFALAKRSRTLINAICQYSNELRRKDIEVYERHVNIIHTEQGYYCAFFEDDVKKNRTEEKEGIKPFKGIDGRMKIILTDKEGNQVLEDVATLVATTYLANPNGYKYVTFKDGNPENVKAENLEWSEIEPKNTTNNV